MSVTTLERPKDNKVLAFLANAKEATSPDAPETSEATSEAKAKAKPKAHSPYKQRRADGTVVVMRDGLEEEYGADGQKLSQAEKAKRNAARGGQLTNEEKLAQLSGNNIAKDGTSVGKANPLSAASMAAEAQRSSQSSGFSRLLATGTNFLSDIGTSIKNTWDNYTNKAVQLATNFKDAVIDGAKRAGQFFAETTSNVIDGAKKIGGAVIDGAKKIGGAVVEGAQKIGGAVVDGAKRAGTYVAKKFDETVDAGKKLVTAGVDKAKEAGRAARDTVVGWKDSAVALFTGDKDEPATQAAAKPRAPAPAKPAAHAPLVGEKHDVKPAKKEESLSARFTNAVHAITPWEEKPAPTTARPATKVAAVAHP